MDLCFSFDLTLIYHMQGTAIFAAVETGRKVFRHAPVKALASRGGGHSHRRDIFAKLQANPIIPFRYHPYHDLEALFWVVVWIVFHYLMATTPGATVEGGALEAWHRESLKLFNATKFTEKTAIFDRPEEMWKLILSLRRWGWSEALLNIWFPILEFRGILLQAYTELQSQPPGDGQVWGLDRFSDDPYIDLGQRCADAVEETAELESMGSTVYLTYVMKILKQHQEGVEQAKAEKETLQKDAALD
jgi:hypothetical protein